MHWCGIVTIHLVHILLCLILTQCLILARIIFAPTHGCPIYNTKIPLLCTLNITTAPIFRWNDWKWSKLWTHGYPDKALGKFLYYFISCCDFLKHIKWKGVLQLRLLIHYFLMFLMMIIFIYHGGRQIFKGKLKANSLTPRLQDGNSLSLVQRILI